MLKIIAGLTLGLVASPAHAQECYNRLTQDLNCNAVDATDEVAVDLEDPTCAENLDDDGNPYPNADFYVEYFAFGCQHLTVDMDEGNAGTLLKLIDALDDDDDVQTVWGNYDISDEVMDKVG